MQPGLTSFDNIEHKRLFLFMQKQHLTKVKRAKKIARFFMRQSHQFQANY